MEEKDSIDQGDPWLGATAGPTTSATCLCISVIVSGGDTKYGQWYITSWRFRRAAWEWCSCRNWSWSRIINSLTRTCNYIWYSCSTTGCIQTTQRKRCSQVRLSSPRRHCTRCFLMSDPQRLFSPPPSLPAVTSTGLKILLWIKQKVI